MKNKLYHYFYRIQYSAIVDDISMFFHEQIPEKYYSVTGFNPVM